MTFIVRPNISSSFLRLELINWSTRPPFVAYASNGSFNQLFLQLVFGSRSLLQSTQPKCLDSAQKEKIHVSEFLNYWNWKSMLCPNMIMTNYFHFVFLSLLSVCWRSGLGGHLHRNILHFTVKMSVYNGDCSVSVELLRLDLISKLIRAYLYDTNRYDDLCDF